MTTPPERRGLAQTLRALVEGHPSSLREIAARSGTSPSTLSRWISGHVLPPEAKLQRLLTVLEVTDDQRAQILATREHLRSGFASRTVLHRAGVARLQQRWAAFEESAEHIQGLTLQYIPWMVQTPDYMRVLFGTDGTNPQEVEQAVAARRDRQQLVHDPSRRFTDIVCEGALRWQVHSPSLMIEQLERLAAAVRHSDERARIGIIPWTTPMELFPLATFSLYDERAVIIGTGAGTTVLDKPGDVAPFVTLHRRLAQAATYGESGAQVVEQITDDYRRLRDAKS